MRQKRLWVRGVVSYILASLFLLYEMGLQVSPSIMIDQLMFDFRIGAALLGAMTGVYFYSYTPVQIPAGFFYDRFGPRRLIACATVICAIGALIFGFAYDIVTAAFGRFCMGFGSAFAFIGSLTVAARWFPKHFALCAGITQFLAAVGALSGAIPLAVLVNIFDWRTVIIATGWIGIGLGLFCFWIIRDQPPNVEWKRMRHRDLLRECREIFKSHQTWWIALYSFFSWGPTVVFAALWGVPFLMIRYQISNTQAAFAIGMIWIGIGIAGPFLGYLSDRIKRRKPLLLITSVIGLIAAATVLYIHQLPFFAVFPLLVAFGIASAGQILCFAIAKDINKRAVVSTALGLNNMAVVAGGALLQPLVGFLISFFWDGKSVEGVPVYSLASYRIGLFIIPLCFFLALLISIFCIRETYCSSRLRHVESK
ncbi:MAG: MFS transporter [Chlamydiota bacterium]